MQRGGDYDTLLSNEWAFTEQLETRCTSVTLHQLVHLKNTEGHRDTGTNILQF